MKVLAALSGGVDSSVAAALLLDAGHEVTGVTMRLWGGPSDTGCCSVADVDDARRVAQQLGIAHHVFNFSDEFDALVMAPYVADHAAGRTPNPCVECNRHLKFDHLLRRAEALGFDAVATGHHARVVTGPDGRRRVARGADAAKDQSYVLHMLGADVLDRVLFPVGDLDKAAVRAEAERLGLRTADKPDSQDVCFISATAGRERFLGDRIPLRPARIVDTAGTEVGTAPAVELVTIGQRKGLGLAGGAAPRYVVAVDPGGPDHEPVVTVGARADLLTDHLRLTGLRWSADPVPGPVAAQCSAHGPALAATLTSDGEGDGAALRWDEPQRRVAPGQSVVLYAGDVVVAGATAAP